MKKEKVVPHSCDEVPMKGEFQEINNFLPMILTYFALVNEKVLCFMYCIEVKLFTSPILIISGPDATIFNMKNFQNAVCFSCSQ